MPSRLHEYRDELALTLLVFPGVRTWQPRVEREFKRLVTVWRAPRDTPWTTKEIRSCKSWWRRTFQRTSSQRWHNEYRYAASMLKRRTEWLQQWDALPDGLSDDDEAKTEIRRAAASAVGPNTPTPWCFGQSADGVTTGIVAGDSPWSRAVAEVQLGVGCASGGDLEAEMAALGDLDDDALAVLVARETEERCGVGVTVDGRVITGGRKARRAAQAAITRVIASGLV